MTNNIYINAETAYINCRNKSLGACIGIFNLRPVSDGIGVFVRDNQLHLATINSEQHIRLECNLPKEFANRLSTLLGNLKGEYFHFHHSTLADHDWCDVRFYTHWTDKSMPAACKNVVFKITEGKFEIVDPGTPEPKRHVNLTARKESNALLKEKLDNVRAYIMLSGVSTGPNTYELATYKVMHNRTHHQGAEALERLLKDDITDDNIRLVFGNRWFYTSERLQVPAKVKRLYELKHNIVYFKL